MSPQDISETMVKSYADASAQAAVGAQPPAAEALRIVLDVQAASPLATAAPGVGVVSTDICGAFSVEKFAAASNLTYTHEDAGGWLESMPPPNFWYRDAGVAPWAYYEQYDNWQDTYGFDAVMAVYNTGHGAMDGNGVF